MLHEDVWPPQTNRRTECATVIRVFLTIEQRRALQQLTDAPNGHTDAALWGRGFSPALLVGLMRVGYVAARPHTMKAAGRTFAVMRFVITEAGRRAIG
jgi:hypothetical protein